MKTSIKYKCEVCKLTYKDKQLAEKCETWCKKHSSCNVDIIKHAIQE